MVKECKIWSSHARDANGIDETRIKSHPAYIAIVAIGAARKMAYPRLFDEGLSNLATDALRMATN